MKIMKYIMIIVVMKENVIILFLNNFIFPFLYLPLLLKPIVYKELYLFDNIILDYLLYNNFNMRVYAGTYQGQIAIFQGLPSELFPKSNKQVSENSIRAVAECNHQILIGGYDQQLRSINPMTGEEMKESKQSEGIINCIAKINDSLAVIGLDNGTMRFWDAEKWICKKTVKEHKKAITDMKVDSEGVMLVSAAGRQINFWNIANLNSLYHYKFDFDIQKIILGQSFKYLFILGDTIIRQVSTEDNKQLQKTNLNSKIQCGIIFGDFLIIATQKGEIRTWRTNDLSKFHHFQAHQGRIKDMKSVKVEDVNYLVTADANGVVSVWDFLDFLDKVHDKPEDYPLLGLQAECTIKINQRITAIEVIPLVIKYKDESKPEKIKPEVKVSNKKNDQKTKQIKKAQKKSNKQGKNTQKKV